MWIREYGLRYVGSIGRDVYGGIDRGVDGSLYRSVPASIDDRALHARTSIQNLRMELL